MAYVNEGLSRGLDYLWSLCPHFLPAISISTRTSISFLGRARPWLEDAFVFKVPMNSGLKLSILKLMELSQETHPHSDHKTLSRWPSRLASQNKSSKTVCLEWRALNHPSQNPSSWCHNLLGSEGPHVWAWGTDNSRRPGRGAHWCWQMGMLVHLNASINLWVHSEAGWMGLSANVTV